MNHWKNPYWLCVQPSLLINGYRGIKGPQRKVGLSLLVARLRMSGSIPQAPICLHGEDRNKSTALLTITCGNGDAACGHGFDIHLWWRHRLCHAGGIWINVTRLECLTIRRQSSWYQSTLYSPVVTICTIRFNIKQFYVLHTQCICVLCGSENKQRLFHYSALNDWFL